jgi:hypothetical protein
MLVVYSSVSAYIASHSKCKRRTTTVFCSGAQSLGLGYLHVNLFTQNKGKNLREALCIHESTAHVGLG